MRPPLLELPKLALEELVLALCELMLEPPPLVVELPEDVGVAGPQQVTKTDATAHR